MELEEGNHKLLISLAGCLIPFLFSSLYNSCITKSSELELPVKVVLNGADLRRVVKPQKK